MKLWNAKTIKGWSRCIVCFINAIMCLLAPQNKIAVGWIWGSNLMILGDILIEIIVREHNVNQALKPLKDIEKLLKQNCISKKDIQSLREIRETIRKEKLRDEL